MNDTIFLIISIVLNYGFIFLMTYCYDEAQLWDDAKYYYNHPYQPTLQDLIDKDMVETFKSDTDEEIERKKLINDGISYDNNYQKSEYVKHIISPSYYYFKILNEMETKQDKNSSGYFMLLTSLIVLMTFALYNIEFTQHIWLCVIISLIFCVFNIKIIELIYRKTPLAIKNFDADVEKLKKQYGIEYDHLKSNDSLEFNISKEHYINNYIIECHKNYLLSIRETVLFRRSIRKILSSFAGIIFFLFIFRFPNY